MSPELVKPEREHHAVSPSKLPMLAKCLCYESAPVGAAANEGTRQHEQLAAILTDKPCADGIEIHPGVAWAAEYINRCTSNILLIEERMSLIGDDFEEITFGTLDVVAAANRADGDKIFVMDYKSGEDWNYGPQMAAYARMAMIRYGRTICEVHELYGRYCQAKKYSLTMAETDYIPGLIAAAQAPDRRPTMCEFCGWCVKQGTCGAAVEPILRVATDYEPESPVAKLPLSAVATWRASEITDPNQMAVVLDVASYLYAWASAAKAHAREAAVKGMEIPGYVLKDGAARREFADITAAYAASGLGADAFLACCSASVVDVSRAMAARAGHKSEKVKAAKEDFDRAMAGIVVRKQAAPQLVKAAP